MFASSSVARASGIHADRIRGSCRRSLGSVDEVRGYVSLGASIAPQAHDHPLGPTSWVYGCSQRHAIKCTATSTCLACRVRSGRQTPLTARRDNLLWEPGGCVLSVSFPTLPHTSLPGADPAHAHTPSTDILGRKYIEPWVERLVPRTWHLRRENAKIWTKV